MTDYATVDSAASMRAALRRRIAELGISLETLEELSGCQRGYTTRVLSEPAQKRATIETFLWLVEAVGLELTLRVNSLTAAKMAPRYLKRRLTRVMRAGTQSPLEVGLRHLSRLGNKARSRKLSPERRSELARNAAQARWGHQRAGA